MKLPREWEAQKVERSSEENLKKKNRDEPLPLVGGASLGVTDCSYYLGCLKETCKGLPA